MNLINEFLNSCVTVNYPNHVKIITAKENTGNDSKSYVTLDPQLVPQENTINELKHSTLN